jgi:universal stress protein A
VIHRSPPPAAVDVAPEFAADDGGMEAALAGAGGHIMVLAIKTILVPTDFSPNSLGALQYAEALARRFGAAVHLLHVCQPATLTAATVEAALIALPDADAESRSAAAAEMEKVRALIADVPVTTEIDLGSPAPCIVAAAVEHAADLIVMGTHGRGPLLHMMLGSVAERVVRAAPCPVLTIRAPRTAAAIATVPAPSLAAVAVGGVR